ncbi:MAG: FAD:protein FMN transferase [Paracoccaceae bacterium]|nr:FAD:protein FMN transferase [Paracoccaceae bacterium]
MNRRRFLTLSAAFACAPHLAQAATWRGRALGAEVAVTLHGLRLQVDAALAAIPDQLNEIEALFSLYRPDSWLMMLNRYGYIEPPKPFARLMSQVDTVHDLTSGLFDPTVQLLWRALAEGRNTARARALIGWHRVQHDAQSVRLAPGQLLTFNGIAQGFATDLIRDHLRAQGFTKALIDIGEQAAVGGPFRLGLEDPQQGYFGHRTLQDTAIATSSPGALPLGDQTHILSPDGRAPLWSTISIEAPSATLADALSTAAVFLPRAELRRLKAKTPITRITAVDANGSLITL